jgi:peptide/nickel transport system permease protein
MTEDDHPGYKPSVAIDLSRRKDPAGRVLVRESIVGAGRVAAPYVTMARIALTRLSRDRLARAGGIFMALLALVGIFADLLASDLPIACRWRGVVYVLPNITRPPALAGVDNQRIDRDRGPTDWAIPPLVPYGPIDANDAGHFLVAPMREGHPLGTDAVGRDVFARIVHGARTGLGVGLAASVVLVIIGVGFGAVAGFAGGIVDAFVARVVESLSAIPTLVLVLVVGGLVAHPTTVTLMSTIALTRWTELARLVRAEVLLALGADYVSAARALGASPARVLWRHVLPNAIGPALVGATFAIAWVVLIEATIDFLRVGSADAMTAMSAMPSWGETMGEARLHGEAWWLVAFPGALLLTTLIALNLVGEAARNALDPRLRGNELAN